MKKQKPRLRVPPATATRVLRQLLLKEEENEKLGDLSEAFDQIQRQKGFLRAYLWYWVQLLRMVPVCLENLIYWRLTMMKNNIKAGFRSIMRRKVISLINISSLAIGLAFAILVFFFVRQEHSYDRFHENSDNIYRVMHHDVGEREDSKNAFVPMRLAQDLKKLYPEIEYGIRISAFDFVVSGPKDSFSEKVAMAEEDYFKVFSFPLIQGDKKNPLKDIHNIVISQQAAEKYFPNAEPIGQQLGIELRSGKMVFQVSAVYDNKKPESSLVFDFIIPFAVYEKRFGGKFMMTSFQAMGGETYLKLRPGTDLRAFNQKLAGLKEHLPINARKGYTYTYFLQPLKDIYLNHFNTHTLTLTGQKLYSYILTGLAVLVLLISCINFLTTSLGTALKRSFDVGVRKVVGATKKQLARQYLGEAMLVTTIAMVFGNIMAALFLPMFNSITGKNLIFLADLKFVCATLVLTLIVGLAAGIYPAVVLARFNPVRVLKGSAGVNGKNMFSKTLIVLQFVFSVFLIISTLVMKKQLNFVQTMDIGYDREMIVQMAMNTNGMGSGQIFERFKSRVKDHNQVISVSAAATPAGGRWSWLGVAGKSNDEITFNYNLVDVDYIKTMSIPIALGRNFSVDYPADKKNSVIVNETFIKRYGLKRPIGSRLPGNFTNQSQIIGVIKDFHFASLHQQISPVVLSLSADPVKAKFTSLNTPGWPPALDQIVIRIKPGDPKPVIEFLGKIWRQVSPGSPVEISFVSDKLDRLYRSEQNWGRIINHATFLALLISCLGLFGLSMLAAEKRLKEIGIRKVLGAASGRLVIFMSKDLLRLVLLANFIAWPVSYYVMKLWLNNFAYRIDIEPILFVITGILTFFIAAATISFQTARAAMTNPVEIVKYE